MKKPCTDQNYLNTFFLKEEVFLFELDIPKTKIRFLIRSILKKSIDILEN